MKYFRIRNLGKGMKLRFLVEERHTILFFIHFWDFGSSSLSPHTLYDSYIKAAAAVSRWCKKNNRKYRIVKYEEKRIDR